MCEIKAQRVFEQLATALLANYSDQRATRLQYIYKKRRIRRGTQLARCWRVTRHTGWFIQILWWATSERTRQVKHGSMKPSSGDVFTGKAKRLCQVHRQ